MEAGEEQWQRGCLKKMLTDTLEFSQWILADNKEYYFNEVYFVLNHWQEAMQSSFKPRTNFFALMKYVDEFLSFPSLPVFNRIAEQSSKFKNYRLQICSLVLSDLNNYAVNKVDAQDVQEAIKELDYALKLPERYPCLRNASVLSTIQNNYNQLRALIKVP